LIADRLGAGSGRFDSDTLLELLHRVEVNLHDMDFGLPDEGVSSHSLALSRISADGRKHFYLMVNAYWEVLDFTLPAAPIDNGQGWRLWIDTSQRVAGRHPWLARRPAGPGKQLPGRCTFRGCARENTGLISLSAFLVPSSAHRDPRECGM